MLQDPKSFANILPNFLNAWLQLGCVGEKGENAQANMSVRIKALNCVENCVQCLEQKDVVIMRRDVMKKLSLALDDRKRLVRKAAAMAKNKWCLVG